MSLFCHAPQADVGFTRYRPVLERKHAKADLQWGFRNTAFYVISGSPAVAGDESRNLWYFWTMNELLSASQDAAAPSCFARVRSGLLCLLRQALDVALPPLCPPCREPLGDGVGLCAACWSKLSLIEPPYCVQLNIPFTYDPGPGHMSMQAIANRPVVGRARAPVRFDDIARTLVLGFKYGDQLDLTAMMGRWMARAGHELTRDADALLSVPLHWHRLWARRFNQSAALAAAISDICGVPVLYDALERVRAIPQQVGISKPERADNVQGAFRVPADQKVSVAGRRLVLIDYVLTFGATVDTCARALLWAGAAHADVLVFARFKTPVRSPI